MEITKEKFEAIVKVRDSGLTNMFEISRVRQLANQLADVQLTRNEVQEMFRNWATYKEKYKIK